MLSNRQGSSTVELVCILPWLVLALMTIVGISILFFKGSLLQYGSFRGARILKVYRESHLQEELGRLVPKAKGLYHDGLLQVKLGRLQTAAPVEFALRGETRILSAPGTQDKKGQYLLDNPVAYCGSGGDYGLCDN